MAGSFIFIVLVQENNTRMPISRFKLKYGLMRKEDIVMETKDLEIFNDVPFLFWVKDGGGRYLWGNRTISQLAGEEVAGKTDRELLWADNADSLQAGDKQVFESGKPNYLHEYGDKSSHGKATLNVCKWLGDFEGHKCCFRISFIMDE